MKTKSIVKQLEEKYGGHWKYIPFFGWVCEELDMTAHYVYEGGYDIDGSPINDSRFFKLNNALRIYGNGKNGEKFYPKRKIC